MPGRDLGKRRPARVLGRIRGLVMALVVALVIGGLMIWNLLTIEPVR